MNMVSSSATTDFYAFRRLEERLHALQLQLGAPTIEEIKSAMGGLCTGKGYALPHYAADLMRHRAFVESSLTKMDDLHTNNVPSPPWSGKVVSMAMDNRECQYLHTVIDEGNPTYLALILSEVKDHLHDLMTHRFGSSLIQKIFEVKRGMTWLQMDFIVYLIISNNQKLWDVCINYHGNRVIQIMLENIRHPFTKFVVVYIMNHITTTLMKNTNGGYVIVQCLKVFPPGLQKIILDEVARNCVDIASDKLGCLNVKRCLKHGGRTAIDLLVTKIISNAMVLAEDPYGNYVVQYVIKMKFPLAKEWMIEELCNKFDRLSVNKYASNVVEALLRFSNKKVVEVIVEEIMRSRNFLNVLQNPFGNYVAQRALKCTQGRLRKKLSSLIKSHRIALQSHIYGKNVLKIAMAYTEENKFKRLRHQKYF